MGILAINNFLFSESRDRRSCVRSGFMSGANGPENGTSNEFREI